MKDTCAMNRELPHNQPIAGSEHRWQDERINTQIATINTIWGRAVPVLGLFTMQVILQRAIRLTARQYPPMNHLMVSDKGLHTTHIHRHINEAEYPLVSQGFEALIPILLGLLTELTGKQVADKLFTDEVLKKQDTKQESHE
jgi:hypothetical protein